MRVFVKLSWAPLNWVGRYSVNLLASTLGVWFSAKILGEIFLAPVIGKQNLLLSMLKPPYPLLVVMGILVGYVSGIRWRSSHAFWVWIPPAAYLGMGIILWLHTGFHFYDALEHYFGLGCYPSCRDQYSRTVPFYTAVAYSFGAIMHRTHHDAAQKGEHSTPSDRIGPRV